jgi:hypothetical protein
MPSVSASVSVRRAVIMLQEPASMLNTILRLLMQSRGRRHDQRGFSSKSWKKPKKSRRHDGGQGGDRYGYMPPGRHRPRGLKAILIDAVLRRLLKR